jgi:cysteinyl-tRNA synthetase
VAELHKLANEVFRGDAAAARQLRALGSVLGLLQRDAEAFLQSSPEGSLSDAEIRQRIDARLAARKARNYPEADRIRQGLEAAGVILEDGPQGTTWRRA